MDNIRLKLNELHRLLADFGSAAVALSGGIDSTFLLVAAKKALGDKVTAVTAYSPATSQEEMAAAVEAAAFLGVRHTVLDTAELSEPDFIRNDCRRCYYCKRHRFGRLVEWAKEQGYPWVLEGSNADDLNDFRPGMQALGEFREVVSPLLKTGFTKAEIREVSRNWGIANWDRPSAACLVSRLAYGRPITVEVLRQVEQAELIIKKFYNGQVRVRHHGDLARIEVPPQAHEMFIQPELRQHVAAELKKLGFAYVTLDLVGYRTGSMNEMLE